MYRQFISAMKITIVSGARPNFMKIAPLCRAIDAAREAGKNISYRIVYTGPQDDTTLDASLFSDLAMRKPDAYLGISGRDHSQVAAAIMLAFERELDEHPAQVVLVVDDMLGKNNGFAPKFLRRYADLHKIMTDAIGNYISDVRSGSFPNKDEQY